MPRIIPFLAVMLAGTANPSFAEPACTLPESVERPDVRRPDYRNANRRTDHLAWVLSWSPEHCAREASRDRDDRHRFQCGLNRFGFVVHGLWPQHRDAASSRDHPRHCRGSQPLSAELVRRHLCTVPGAQLMQHQWQAHGTCHWSTPGEYFDAIERLATRFRRPDHRQLTRGAAPVATMKSRDVKQAFIDVNPGLAAQHLRVTVGPGNWLKEVRICLTPDRQAPSPVPCPAGGTPDGQLVRVRAPAGSR